MQSDQHQSPGLVSGRSVVVWRCSVLDVKQIQELIQVSKRGESGAGYVFWQRVGRCVGGVIGAAGDDGLIRVAVEVGGRFRAAFFFQSLGLLAFMGDGGQQPVPV